MKDKKQEEIIQGFIKSAINMDIFVDMNLDYYQIDLINGLHEYCVYQVLNDVEVLRDPRKISYKASFELRYALIAILLAHSLTQSVRSNKQNKKYFFENISISAQDSDAKIVSFGDIDVEIVKESIYEEIIEDWKIYRDKTGYGISNLIDEKTNLQGLNGFIRGGDPLYEFARFYRKFAEKERYKDEKARENAKEGFRSSVVQSLAVEYAKQQLLEGKSPMELIDSLFDDNVQKSGRKKNIDKIDSRVQGNISLLLEGPDKEDE